MIHIFLEATCTLIEAPFRGMRAGSIFRVYLTCRFTYSLSGGMLFHSYNIYALAFIFTCPWVSWSHYWKRPFQTSPCHQSRICVEPKHRQNKRFNTYSWIYLCCKCFVQTRFSLHNDRGIVFFLRAGCLGGPGGGGGLGMLEGAWGASVCRTNMYSVKFEILKVWTFRVFTSLKSE